MTTIDPHARNYVSASPYSYVNDNPVSSIDPDGRDIIVLSAPDHVVGLGHAEVLIENEKTGYKYYSKNGTHEGLRAYGKSDDNPVSGRSYASLKDFENSEDNRDPKGSYKVAYQIKTYEATDKKMEAAAADAVKSFYKLLDQSCIDVASDALKAGNLNPGFDPPINIFNFKIYTPDPVMAIPRLRFNRIVRFNPGGVLFDVPPLAKEKKGTITVEPVSKPTFIPNEKQNQ